MKHLYSITMLAMVYSLGSCFDADAQSTDTPDFVVQELDSYVTQSLENWKIPGVAVCIVKDGKVVVAKGYGVKEYGNSSMVDQHTLFSLGSTSKAFVATALANLVYQDKCSLDDPVIKWLPQFGLSDPWVTENITLQDLLSHRIGLGRFQGDFMFFDTDLTKDDFYRILKQLELKNEFRSYGYSNIGYFLIGEAIERISGDKLSVRLAQDIFIPLGMSNTLSSPTKFTEVSNRAKSHTLQNGKVVPRRMGNMELMAASGGISSSVSDLSHWLLAQLDSGRLNGHAVLPNEVLQMVRKPQILIGKSGAPYTLFNSSNFENYASGWYNIDYQGTEIVTHNGGGYGFTSSITLVPEHQLGIAILTNSDEHLLFDALKIEIIDAYLGLPFRNYSKMAQRFYQFQKQQKQQQLEQLKQQVASAPQSPIPLTYYTGEYNNHIYGNITISQKNSGLLMKFEHHDSLEAKMEFLEEGKFLTTFNQDIYGTVIIPFEMENDQVIRLSLSVDDNVEPHHYVFEKVDN